MTPLLFYTLLIAIIGTHVVAKGGNSKGNSKGGSLIVGDPKCTTGADRCLHLWEKQSLETFPNQGGGVCRQGVVPVLKEFNIECQFDDVQEDVMVVDCGGPGTNSVKLHYPNGNAGKATLTASGSARAVFSKTRPQNGHNLPGGTAVAPDANTDAWVFCYDQPALMRIPASGTSSDGTPNCDMGHGGGRCMSFWHADYQIFNQIDSSGVCVSSYPENPAQAFFDVCSLSLQGAVHWPVICDPRGNSSLDVSWDAKGNGKAITKGVAKAIFADKPPASLDDLRSGTVTSTKPNQNAYMYCNPVTTS